MNAIFEEFKRVCLTPLKNWWSGDGFAAAFGDHRKSVNGNWSLIGSSWEVGIMKFPGFYTYAWAKFPLKVVKTIAWRLSNSTYFLRVGP